MLKDGTQLGELEALAEILSEQLQVADEKTVAAIAKQYRETLGEIERVKGMEQTNDEIDDILSKRASDGKPGAIRPDSTLV